MPGGELHTFVFADLAGYSALTEAHGDEEAADAAADFVRAARELLRDYSAEEVKTIGDALLIRMESVGDAVEVSKRLICELGVRERALGIRVAMHTGTAVERDGDWFGSGVNIAARAADAARSGQVVLTGASRELAAPDLALRHLGRHRFKNIADPVELYSLVLDDHLPSDRVIDPVCRMSLELGSVRHQTEYRGRTFFFCSQRCVDAFEHDPRVYTSRSGGRDHLLVSERARARAAKSVGGAYRRGRLEVEELEQRMELVAQARTRADLKSATSGIPRSRRRRVWQALLWPPVVFRRLRRWARGTDD